MLPRQLFNDAPKESKVQNQSSPLSIMSLENQNHLFAISPEAVRKKIATHWDKIEAKQENEAVTKKANQVCPLAPRR